MYLNRSLRFLCFVSLVLVDSSSARGHDQNAWKSASRYISEYMDRRASPCSNIDRFVCAKFGAGSADYQFNFADQAVMKVLEFGKAVESIDLINPKTANYARPIRQFYDECSLTMNNPRTLNEAYKVLKEALGEFPAIEQADNSNSSSESIWYFMGHMQRKLGISVGLSAGLETSELTIRNEIPDQEFPMDYVRNQIIHVARSLKKNVDTVRVVKLVLEARALFNDWRANATLASTGDPVTVKYSNLSEIVPDVDWSSYFRGLFPEESFDDWRTSDSDVSLTEPQVIQTIATIFRRHSLEAAKMLMYGKTFQTLMTEFTKNVDESQSALLALKQNLNQTRSMRCLSYIMDNMPVAATRILFDYLRVDPLRWRNDIMLITSNVFSAMRLLLNSISYLSPVTKENIQKKLDATVVSPPIPSWIMDDRRAMKNALDYNGTQSLFMKNVEKAQKEFLRLITKFVPVPEDISMAGVEFFSIEDPAPTFEQNLFYYPEPSIRLLLGLCLPPSFHVNYPLAVKYGLMGALIGHELMHGFGVQGVRRGSNVEQPLLTHDELKIYDRQKQCLISQYSQRCFQNGHCLVGEKAIEDNIADIGGLKVAYAAYQFAKEAAGDDPPLPDLEHYTNDQLFFIAYERWYCARNAPPELWMTLDHTPDAARGPIALRNNPHFAVAFGCPVGSPLAPERPCEMWGDILGTAKRRS